MDIINNLLILPLTLALFAYLILSKFRQKSIKCQYCKKDKMQVTKLEPKSVNYIPNGLGLEGAGGGKSEVLTKVTYKYTNCPEFIIPEENR